MDEQQPSPGTAPSVGRCRPPNTSKSDLGPRKECFHMANLGNVWHRPANPEPRGRAGMRDPVFPTNQVASVTITTGNQFQGGGNQGNQLQDGSSLFFKRTIDVGWTPVPLIFVTVIGNNKYYSADIPIGAFGGGVVVQYNLRIAYDDHDTTFLQLSTEPPRPRPLRSRSRRATCGASGARSSRSPMWVSTLTSCRPVWC